MGDYLEVYYLRRVIGDETIVIEESLSSNDGSNYTTKDSDNIVTINSNTGHKIKAKLTNTNVANQGVKVEKITYQVLKTDD